MPTSHSAASVGTRILQHPKGPFQILEAGVRASDTSSEILGRPHLHASDSRMEARGGEGKELDNLLNRFPFDDWSSDALFLVLDMR